MKPLVFTRHARTKIEERGIAPSWVDDTVRAPLWTEPDPGDPILDRRFRPIPEFGERILRVVFSKTDTTIRIITATFDRNARRDP